jgi:hypothetical protein
MKARKKIASRKPKGWRRSLETVASIVMENACIEECQYVEKPIRRHDGGLAWASAIPNLRRIVTPRPDSIQNLFFLAHEVGHVITPRLGDPEPQYVREYRASKWAIEELQRLGGPVPDVVIADEKQRIAELWLATRRRRTIRREVGLWLADPPGVCYEDGSAVGFGETCDDRLGNV